MALVGQDWHDLAWRQGGVLGLVAREQDWLRFLLAEGWASSLAREPVEIPSSRISRAFWRSSGVVSPPRPLPRRPGFFLRHIAARKPAATTVLPQRPPAHSATPPRPPGLFPYGADPVLAA